MNQSHIRKIKAFLLKLGLSEPEIKTYLVGLQLGPASIQQIASRTKIKRVTTHVVVQKLVNKGLFLESLSKKRRLVYPSDLNSLSMIVDRKKSFLNKIENDLKDMQNILNLIQSEREEYPKVRIFEGIEGFTQILKESIEDKKDMFVISNSYKFADIVGWELILDTYEKRVPLKLRTQMIFPKGFDNAWKENKRSGLLTSIRNLKNIENFEGSINIRGSKVAISCLNKSFLNTTIIENIEISKMMKFIFETMWQVAKN